MYQGKEYPLVRVPISSSSHPFFTKANQFIDSEGRVDKFTKKYQRQSEQEKLKQQKQEEALKEQVKAKKSAKKK
jgi:large subunit ribosomal protein L31